MGGLASLLRAVIVVDSATLGGEPRVQGHIKFCTDLNATPSSQAASTRRSFKPRASTSRRPLPT